MRDVPKNVGQDDAHGVHGRTHTQAELRESRPLLLGGLRLLIALVVSVLYGTFDTYSPNKDTSSVWIAGILSSVAALFVLAVVFTSPRNPVGWMCQYWHRNVRGYAVAYWLDDQGKLTGQITTRLPPDWRSMSDRSSTVYLPLGGWLHWPRFTCCLNYLHDLCGVRVRWPWFEDTPDKVWVTDRDGARAKLWMRDALVLWNPRTFSASGFLDLWRRSLRDLEQVQNAHATALALLLEVYDRIVATKRFIKSKQAQDITDDLRQKLYGLLPYDHPRYAEFVPRPMAKAVPMAAKT